VLLHPHHIDEITTIPAVDVYASYIVADIDHDCNGTFRRIIGLSFLWGCPSWSLAVATSGLCLKLLHYLIVARIPSPNLGSHDW